MDTPVVLSLEAISRLVTVQTLLDLGHETSNELAKHVCQCLTSHHYTAVSSGLLSYIVEYYPLRLTDDLLRALVAPHIRTLKLANCHQVTLNGLHHTLSSCRKLEALDLTGCEALVRPVSLKLFVLLAPTVTSMILQSCNKLYDDGVQVVLNSCGLLKHLDVSLCWNITDAAFLVDRETQTSRPTEHGAYRCQLSSVDLSGCRQLTSVAVHNIVTLCGPSLESVNLTFTGVDHMALIYLSGFDFLTSNTFIPVPGPSDHGEVCQLLSQAVYKQCWTDQSQFETPVEHLTNRNVIPSTSPESHSESIPIDGLGDVQDTVESDKLAADLRTSGDIVLVQESEEAASSDLLCSLLNESLHLVDLTNGDLEASLAVSIGNTKSECRPERQRLLSCGRDDSKFPISSNCDDCNDVVTSIPCLSSSLHDGELGIEDIELVDAHMTAPLSDLLGVVTISASNEAAAAAPCLSLSSCHGDNDSSTSLNDTCDQATSSESAEVLPGEFSLTDELDVFVDARSNNNTTDEPNKTQTDDSCTPNRVEESTILMQIYTPQLLSFELSDYYGQLFPCGSIVSHNCWKFFIKSQRRLEKLCIWWAAGEIGALNDIANLSPGITHLCLEGSEAISTQKLREVTLQCTKLKSLQIRGVAFVEDSAVLPVIQRGEVTSLNLSETSVTDVTLHAIARHCHAQIEELHLDCCEEVSDDGLDNMASACTKLRNLSLRQCPISSRGLRNLACGSPNITHLDLSSVNTVDDEVLVFLAMKMNKLTNFDISWNIDVTDVGILAVMQFCSQLRHLNLAGLKQVTSEPFVPIISDHKTWVRSQKILKYKLLEKRMSLHQDHEDDSSDEEMDEFVLPSRSTTYVPMLQRLDLEYVDQVHDDHLAQIVAVCRGSLKIRNYYGCDVSPHLVTTIKGDIYMAKF